MKGSLAEKEIARIWQRQALNGGGLVTEEGEPLQVIFPGRLNDDCGPDFRDAVVLLGRGLLRGDIELHVRASSWPEHGHHLDALYNRVILHVVMRHDTGEPAVLQNGGRTSTLNLSKYINIPLSQWSGLARVSDAPGLFCRRSADVIEGEAMAEWLEKSGEERFQIKAIRFQKDFLQMKPGQSLYQGVMGALGYARNKEPFLEIARRVPLCILESIDGDNLNGTDWINRRLALLLGISGLTGIQVVKNQPGNIPEDSRTGLPANLMESSSQSSLCTGDWQVLKTRPNNAPVNRLSAMGYLLFRYRQQGLLDGLLGLVREAKTGKAGQKSLEAGLVVTGNACSRGFSNPGGEPATLLGRGRAADIIVNILLPFSVAWGQANNEPEFSSKALDIYRHYPKLTGNSVERQMAEKLGLDSRLVNSACRQQGLIHIYRNYCAQGRCDQCALSSVEMSGRTLLDGTGVAQAGTPVLPM